MNQSQFWLEFNTPKYRHGIAIVAATMVLFAGLSCAKKGDEALSSTGKSLYVATGACYSGSGNTAFTNLTSSNVIYKINTTTGAKESLIADYNASPSQTGDSPVSFAFKSASELYVLVENTTTVGARRVEVVQNSPSGSRSTFSNNITALSAQLRSLALSSGGNLLISKTTAVENLSNSNVRITIAGNAYVTPTGGTCSPSATMITKSIFLKNGIIAYTHANAAQNKIGFISPAGYTGAGDCLASQAPVNAASFPTAIAYDPDHARIFVAYASSAVTVELNSIYAYDLNESAVGVTPATVSVTATNKIYDANAYPGTYPFLLYGVSEMAYDKSTSSLYVATAINTATTIANYAIEKFTVDHSKLGTANTTVLSRVGTQPFYPYGVDTKCISQMIIAD